MGVIRVLAGVLATTAVLTAPAAQAQPDNDGVSSFVRNVCRELSVMGHTRADLLGLVAVVMRDNPELDITQASQAVGTAIAMGCPEERFWVMALAPAHRMHV